MKKRSDIAREIDERIRRVGSYARIDNAKTAELPRNWNDNPPAGSDYDNYQFGVDSLGKTGESGVLTGHVKLSGTDGIDIETDTEQNALALSLSEDVRNLLSRNVSYEPVMLTTNDTGGDLITVFRMINRKALYALTASQVWLVDVELGELVEVEGAVPAEGEVFTCACVFQGSTFIGTRETNGQVLVIYRFDGESLSPELVLAANGNSYEVTSMCVVAMSLCALVGGLSTGDVGWRVFRRISPPGWIPVIDWQSGEYAGEIGGTNELVVSSFDGSQSRLWSVELGVGQTAPVPVVNSPGTTQLVATGEVALSRYEREVIVSGDGSLWSIPDVRPKSWSGNEGIAVADLFIQPSVYTTPEIYTGLAAAEVAPGSESAGLFVFGARVEFAVGESTETIGYILGYDGEELIELYAFTGENVPLFRPVETGLDGSLVLTAGDGSEARYVWKIGRSLVESLVYASRS